MQINVDHSFNKGISSKVNRKVKQKNKPKIKTIGYGLLTYNTMFFNMSKIFSSFSDVQSIIILKIILFNKFCGTTEKCIMLIYSFKFENTF